MSQYGCANVLVLSRCVCADGASLRQLAPSRVLLARTLWRRHAALPLPHAVLATRDPVCVCVHVCAAISEFSIRAFPCSREVEGALRAPPMHADAVIRRHMEGLYAGRYGVEHASESLQHTLRAVLCLPPDGAGAPNSAVWCTLIAALHAPLPGPVAPLTRAV